MEILLAHGILPDGHGSLAVTIVALVAMIIPFFVLGGVCVIFLRAHRRDEAAKRQNGEWRNAPSS